jgi:hypothetical protein
MSKTRVLKTCGGEAVDFLSPQTKSDTLSKQNILHISVWSLMIQYLILVLAMYDFAMLFD